MKAMTKKSNEVEKTFNVFRAKVDGKEMTDSEVRKVLKDSTNSEQRQKVWEASKKVGAARRSGSARRRRPAERSRREARLQKLRGHEPDAQRTDH